MARAKKPGTSGDLIRSLVVIIVPLVLITIFFTHNVGDHPVKTVDWRPVLTQARSEAPYPVLAPAEVPTGWRPVQVTWVKVGEPYLNGDPSSRNLWKLGFLNDKNVFIGLTQGDLAPEQLVKEETSEGALDGESVVGDQTWQRWTSPNGRTRSLVEPSAKVTTVISGDLPYEALESYAATLTS